MSYFECLGSIFIYNKHIYNFVYLLSKNTVKLKDKISFQRPVHNSEIFFYCCRNKERRKSQQSKDISYGSKHGQMCTDMIRTKQQVGETG